MQAGLVVLAGLSLALWLYLLVGRGGFWRAQPRLDDGMAKGGARPAVIAVVPARDEADVVGEAVASLLRQDYPGAFAVVLVDDHSRDGTAEAARRAADGLGAGERLTVVAAPPLAPGWTGKLWALATGLERAAALLPEARYLWFTDADIAHDAGNLRRLVGAAEADDRDLVSLMVELSCRRGWERLLIPPFVFFFMKLYPFAWVADPRRPTAAAAGGCVLLRRSALERAGGLAPIRGRLIDDCALARLIKRDGREGPGRIWLGLTTKARSLRNYSGLPGIWRMVARSAYAQLGHSPLLLAGALAGMALAYPVPPIVALAAPWHQVPAAAGLAVAAWALMSVAFWPTLRLYRLSALRAPSLPAAALAYCAMTVGSALAHARGRGGGWKGRVLQRPGAAGG